MYRKTYLEINLDNIANNVKNIISKYSNYKYYMAMIKGNAYTHGMYIVNTLIENGINYLAVSSLDEALEVRKYNSEIGVLVTEIIDSDLIDTAIKNNITLTVEDLEYLKLLKDKCKIHIKINSGMNRLGVSTTTELDEMYDYIKNNKNIELEGIYTHFATPGIHDKYFDLQLHNFRNITKNIDLEKIKMVHLSSSFILLNHPHIKEENTFRVGTIIYGYDVSLVPYSNNFKDKARLIRDNFLIRKNNISPVIRNTKIDLKPALKLKTNVMSIREIKKGDLLGYGESTVMEDMKVAILPVGYEDGIGTNNSGRYVIINNKKYETVGPICMCMMFVKVDDNVKVGDTVTLLGDDLTLGYLSRLNNIGIQETLVSLGQRLKRVYIKNNKIDKEL